MDTRNSSPQFTRAMLAAALLLASCAQDLASGPKPLELTPTAWRTPTGEIRIWLAASAPVMPLPSSASHRPTVTASGLPVSGKWHGRVSEPGWLFEGSFPNDSRDIRISWPANVLRPASGEPADEAIDLQLTTYLNPRPDTSPLGWQDLPDLEHACSCHAPESGPPPRLDRHSLLSTGPTRRAGSLWVTPGEPSASWLLFSLAEEHPLRRGPQMPPPWVDSGEVDSAELLRALEAWVVSGAGP